MASLLLRIATGGLLDLGGLGVGLAGGALAICAICGIYKCSGFRMRDCGCIKWCMRATGTDQFDDFELLIVAHEALYTTTSKRNTIIKCTAGAHTVQTNESSKGIYQQPMHIFIEQGTEFLLVELYDTWERKALASLKLDILKDIRSPSEPVSERLFNMKQKSKTVLNPRIRLTMHLEDGHEVEKGLLSKLNMSVETDLMLRQQLMKGSQHQHQHGAAAGSEKPEEGQSSLQTLSGVDLLMQGCKGHLDQFGSWGTHSQVFLAVRGPPDFKKISICIYKEEREYEKNAKPVTEVDVLKILSVQPDPGRPEVFIVNFVDKGKSQQRLAFRRIDQSRDYWVEVLTCLIKTVRDEKDAVKKVKA